MSKRSLPGTVEPSIARGYWIRVYASDAGTVAEPCSKDGLPLEPAELVAYQRAVVDARMRLMGIRS